MKKIIWFLLLILAISLFVAFLNYLLGYFSGYPLTISDFGITFLFTLGYGAANYCGINLLLYICDKIWGGEGQEKIRLIFRVIGSILITTLVNIIVFAVIKRKPFYEMWGNQYFIFYFLIPVFISIIITFIYFISNFYKELYINKSAKQELVIQKISFQYEGLQQQLSPHFLFNSLNVPDSLIEENPESAQEFTRELSQIYRYVLEQQSKDFTTVGEELEFVENYIRLMGKRFEGAVKYVLSGGIQKDNKYFL